MVGLLKKFLLVLLALVVLYLLSALLLSVASTRTSSFACDKNYSIYVSSNGVHLDLIIPTSLLTGDLQEALNPPHWASYIAFGWGDLEFYINTPRWEDLRFSIAFRALFTNSQSAMHVVWLQSQYPGWTAVPLCEEQLKRINQYVDSSFMKDHRGAIHEVTVAGYTQNDRFYLANGSFNVIQTCNNWVNIALKKAGVRTSIWSPFDKGVLYQVRRTKDEGTSNAEHRTPGTIKGATKK